MKCFNCGELKTKTIYPKYNQTQFVQKWCLTCGWKSHPIEVMKIE